jgi:hypothetical protein
MAGLVSSTQAQSSPAEMPGWSVALARPSKEQMIAAQCRAKRQRKPHWQRF